MKTRTIVFIGLAATSTLTAVAGSGTGAAQQRVSITMKGNQTVPGTPGRFVLAPLQPGAVQIDSGEVEFRVSGPNVVRRDGRTVNIWVVTSTLDGRRGTLTIRERLEWTDMEDLKVAVGTWTVVGGTGAYARLGGSGRSLQAVRGYGNGRWYVRQEGVLIRRR